MKNKLSSGAEEQRTVNGWLRQRQALEARRTVGKHGVREVAMKTPEELFSDNLALAHFAQRRWGWMFQSMNGITHEDARQICYMGLWTAAVSFDSGRGFTFSTFALAHIHGEMRRAYTRERKQQRLGLISVDTAVTAESADGKTIGAPFDLEAPDDVDGYASAAADLRTFMSSQPERVQRIVECRQAGMTQQETAHAMGISQVHVSRIVRNMARQYAAVR